MAARDAACLDTASDTYRAQSLQLLGNKIDAAGDAIAFCIQFGLSPLHPA